MLRRIVSSAIRSHRTTIRGLASEDGKGPKDSTPKEVIGEDLLDAINNVADELHSTDIESKKKTRNTLISKLISHEKTTFTEATSAQSSNMLDDSAMLNLLSQVSNEKKTAQPSRSSQIRQETRGLVVLRREIFYQATQSGYKTEEARIISEKAVQEAQNRLEKQRKARLEGVPEEKETETIEERSEKEQKFFEYAFQVAEKMLYTDELSGSLSAGRQTIRADPNLPSLLKSGKRLGIWNNLDGMKDNSLGFWSEWDHRAAMITNQSMGPENAFEEQIEWTTKGKQWPFPIDNEYLLGDEANVPFIEHIFLERHLPSLGFPKDGPIAHFMELVCVGLSKNPYMSAAKKMEHLRWFANYFNEEKQKLVTKLHEQEAIAAAQNA